MPLDASGLLCSFDESERRCQYAVTFFDLAFNKGYEPKQNTDISFGVDG